MKKKLFVLALMLAIFTCLFAISVSAASTNEFGAVETIPGIDLTGMSEDANARVVLFDGAQYHTYPTQYIVTSNSYFTYDFSKITAKGYNYDINSVIRIEIPNNILSWNTNFSNSNSPLNPLTKYNIIEVYFPEDSTVTTFAYAAFANSPSLKKVNVPKSVTSLGGDLFYGSSVLTEVNFHKDSTITTIPTGAFTSCKSLTKIELPNSITTISDRALDCGNGTVLSELRLSAKLTDFGEMHFPWVQYKDKIFRIYAPDTFLANEEKISTPMYNYQGTFTTYSSSLYSVCIYFCGTKDQLDALIEKSEYDKFTNATLVKYDPTKSDDEYGALNTWTIVYDYNACEAFYDGNHIEEIEDNNPCVLTNCKNCNFENMYVGNDSTHTFVDSYNYPNGFVADGVKSSVCQNDNCKFCAENEPKTSSLSPIFYNFLYSIKEGDKFGIAMFYSVDSTALSLYENATGKTVSYGVVATTKDNITDKDTKVVSNPLDNNGTTSLSKIIAANATNRAPKSVQLIIVGSESAWDAVKSVDFYILGYSFETGANLSYFNTSSSSSISNLSTISFSEI